MCCAFTVWLNTSCEDFLDRQEDEKLTFDKIWESGSDTRAYWITTMSFLPTEFRYNILCDGDPFLAASDEATASYDRQYRWINFGSWNPSNVPYYDNIGMAKFYRGIRECNVFLQNVDRCSDPKITKEQLEQWKVQTRFARAFYYFHMMRLYGPVFLVGDELLDFQATTEDLYRPRNTWEQCVDYVISELQACIDNPAMTDGWPSDVEKGLATKGACQAVIARLKLYSARDLFNGNTLYAKVVNPETKDFPELSGVQLFPQQYKAEKWLEAAKAARVVIDNPLYQLYRAGNDDPYEDYYGIFLKQWNSELIYTSGSTGRWNLAVVMTPTALSGYGGVGPTQQQVDAYAMNNGRYPVTGYEEDGSPVIDDNSGYSEDEFGMSTWKYPAWGGTKAYDLEAPNMYKNREPRFYVSVFFAGDYWHHGTTTKTKISFAKGANSNTTHDFPKAGYLINKYYDHSLNSNGGQGWGDITFPTIRLAEMYLNFIEAVLECEKRNVSYPEKAEYKAKAMELWADLRDRAGLDPITDVYPGASVEELIQLCRQERRIELAFENQRYFDTRTWMIAEDVDAGPMYGMDTSYPGSGSDVPEGYWKRVVFETRVFNPNHYLYPFSQRELDRNKLLTQNYGW